MNIFLDDKTSLKLWRLVTGNPSVALIETDVSRPEPLGLTTAKLDRLEMPQLLNYLDVSETSPLGILVPSGRKRVRSRGFVSHVDKCPRGPMPFRLLASVDEQVSSPIIPQKTKVYALAPANIVLSMARRLRRMHLKGSMDRWQSVLMLSKLCLELCGTYMHDPFDPLQGPVTYGTGPLLCAEELNRFLSAPGREQGLGLAREVATLVYDKSGSPQESFLGPALFYPAYLGGLGLCTFVANEALELDDAKRALIQGRTITPDFYLPDYDSVVEYRGHVHQEGDNPRIDHIRDLDYQTLGIRDFTLYYGDVKTREDFMKSAARIVAVIARKDGPDVTERFSRLGRSKSFLQKQRTLFEVFRPWLR